MSTWEPADLDRIARADEIGISSTRPDGTDRPFVTIWAVREGDALYIRSAYGVDNPWYRRAVRSGTGSIRLADAVWRVAFTAADAADRAAQERIDAVYHAKYDRYGAKIVGTVVGEPAHRSTLRVDPR